MLGAATAAVTVKYGPEEMPAGKSVFGVRFKHFAWLFFCCFLPVSDASDGGDGSSER